MASGDYWVRATDPPAAITAEEEHRRLVELVARLTAEVAELRAEVEALKSVIRRCGYG